MNRQPTTRRCTWALLPVIVASTFMFSQQQASTTAPTIRVSTRMVQVDVVAKDKNNKAVDDLQPTEIEVFENGHRQTLASFALEHPGEHAAPPLPQGIYSNRQSPSGAAPTVVLLLDALNTPFEDQSYARAMLLKFLRTQQAPNQKMAAFGLTDRLLLLQAFTTDPTLIVRSINSSAVESSRILNDQALDSLDQTDAFRQTPISSGFYMFRTVPTSQASQMAQKEELASEADVRIATTLEALARIAKILAGVPGRKTLVWISGGLPLSVELAEMPFGSSQSWYRNRLEYVSTLLNEAHVAVYPVDARGLVADELGNGSHAGLPNFIGGGANLLSAQDTMREMASETGGVAYYNRNDIDHAVALAIDDGATYYSLSYYPSNKKFDGKFRKIAIKSLRSGVRLRYRDGYFALNPEKLRPANPKEASKQVDFALEDRMLDTELTFLGSATPSVEMQAKSIGPPTGVAQVHFLLDASNVIFQPQTNGRQDCSVEFYVVAFSGGRYIAQTNRAMRCDFDSETYNNVLSDGLPADVSIVLPEGLYRLRLLVRDASTGRMGTLDVPYTLRIKQQ